MAKKSAQKFPISLVYEACEELGITQKALAKRIGVPLNTLANWTRSKEIPLYAKKQIDMFLEIRRSTHVLFSYQKPEKLALRPWARQDKELLEWLQGRYLAQFFNCSALIPTLAENGWVCDKRAKIALKLIKEESLQKEYEQLLDWGIGSYAIEGLSVDEAGRWEVDKCKKELNFSEQILFKELIKQNEGAEGELGRIDA